jgi:TetR/AcrR family transcriptional repressor of nem operon
MPRNGSPTRARLLDAAERLVERNGFAATSVEQILAESGSSKGAFFHHFPSKRALAHAMVARYVDADVAMLERGLAAVAGTDHPVDRVLAFLGHYERWAEELVSEDSACLYIAVVTERDLLDDVTSAEVDRAVRAWRRGFVGLLRPAYEAAQVDSRWAPDVEELADHLFATFEGAYLMCRAQRSPEPMRAQLRVLRQLVEGLLAPARVPVGQPG